MKRFMARSPPRSRVYKLFSQRHGLERKGGTTLSDKWLERERGERGRGEWAANHPILVLVIFSSLALGILILSTVVI